MKIIITLSIFVIRRNYSLLYITETPSKYCQSLNIQIVAINELSDVSNACISLTILKQSILFYFG